jgi:hypothetical protein
VRWHWMFPLLVTTVVCHVYASAAFAGQTGEAVSSVARRYRDERPSLSVAACNGLVEDVLRDAGVPVRGNVRTLYAEMVGRGWVHEGRTGSPGDIVFFDDTYDSNNNGRQDDPLSHAAVVVSVDEDGTVHMVHFGSRAIRPLVLNLERAHERRSADGKVLNSYLGKPGYAQEGRRLAGELFRAYASPRGDEEPPPEEPVLAEAEPRVISLPLGLDDPAFTRIWAGKRVSAKHLDGRTCRELWFLRNAIAARHGLPFSHEEARAIFGLVSDYRPEPTLTRAALAPRLTRMDRRNLDSISRREDPCGRRVTAP